MPTTLPVPSPGALRTLRNLALGTSCTIAFSAGLLTEDRRRRIHAAREVHDNAQRLKSSRKYHSAGTAILESFEEQSLKLKDEAYWLPSNVIRNKLSVSVGSYEEAKIHDAPNANPSSSSLPRRWGEPVPRALPTIPTIPTIPPLRHPPRQVHTPFTRDRQRRLATDVTKLLDEDSLDLKAAASRFCQAFQDLKLRDIKKISQPLMIVAARLCVACRKELGPIMAFKIFNQISILGAMDEEDYFLFEPGSLVMSLLKQARTVDSGNKAQVRSTIKKAASVYLKSFEEPPKLQFETMLSPGVGLCMETCNLGLYELTLEVYARMEIHRTKENPPKAVQYLIKATHATGRHKKIFRYFMRFFTQTEPGQVEFYQVVDLVLQSLLQLDRVEQAEDVLNAAAVMAKAENYQLSTTQLMKVLGHEWRTHRDILQTRALFDRLEPLCKLVNHPKAFYVAMVQFCVEAGEEALATSYFEKLRATHRIGPADLRVYGHLALAKAMRRDWANVERDLLVMRECTPGDHEAFGACFVPILRLYVDSHTIEQTEEFIRLYIEKFQLKPDSYITNVVIDAYAKAKEVDSIVRWISFSNAHGISIGSDTLNTILSNLAYTWGFDFGEIWRICHSIRSMHAPAAQFFDKGTLALLRHLATQDSPSSHDLEDRLRQINRFPPLKQLSLGEQPVSCTQLNPNGVYQSMKLSSLNNNFMRSLHLYKHAGSHRVPLGPKHLSLAVRSSLQLQRGTSEAIRLIQEAREKGIDVSESIAAVFVHQLTPVLNEDGPEMAETNATNLITLATSTVEACERANIQVSPFIMTHTASILQRKGYYRSCLDFCNFMTRRLNMPTSSFDVSTFTVLCNAYIKLQDPKGVQWAINTMKQNGIVPDFILYSRFKEAQRVLTRKTESEDCSFKLRQFLECVIQARQQLKEMRAEHRFDKESIRMKTIQIMEAAVEEQAFLHRESNHKQEKSLTTVGPEIEMGLEGTLSGLGNKIPTDSRSETDGNNRCDIVVTPSRLVGTAVG